MDVPLMLGHKHLVNDFDRYIYIYGLPPLPPTSYIVARRPSLVARHWGISEFRYACFGEFAAFGQRS